jgi:phage-related protein
MVMGAQITQPITFIKTGTYTGNGAASQAITVGFRPKVISIMETVVGDKESMHKTNQMSGAFAFNSGSGFRDDEISIDSNGFTVYDGTGDINKVNVNSETYAYIAFG